MKKKKRWILLLAVILGMAWLYPFNQSVVYKKDETAVKAYKADIKVLKETYITHTRKLKNKDLTAHRITYFLEMYEQPWLVSEKRVRVNSSTIEEMAWRTRDTREMIIQLLDRETFTPAAEESLFILLNQTIELEHQIETLQYHTASRLSIEHGLSNLHGSFINHFFLFTAFYNAHVQKQ